MVQLRHPPLLWSYALRHISLENPVSLLSHRAVQSWSSSELPDRFTSPAPSSCSGNGAHHSIQHIPEPCRAWQPVLLPSRRPRGEAIAGVAQS